MKFIYGICLSLCWLLVSCAGGTSAPENISPTKPPVKVQPGGSSILVPATLSPADKTALPAQSLVRLTLTNQSDWSVCYVYISPPSEDTWGNDWLGSEEIVKFNQSRIFEVQPGVYDIRAENCDYIGLNEQYEIDVSTSTNWVVYNPAVLEIDSFQDKGIWKTGGSGATGGITDNAYILKGSQPGGLAFATSGKNFDNLVLTIEATPLAPDASSPAGYGLMCRVQSNGDGYLFLIREDGMYGVFRVESNERIPIVDWKSSQDVYSDAQLNVIEAHCDGEYLGLRINGVTVEKLNDSNYSSGDIGLAVLPGQAGSAQIQFDNLVVTKP